MPSASASKVFTQAMTGKSLCPGARLAAALTDFVVLFLVPSAPGGQPTRQRQGKAGGPAGRPTGCLQQGRQCPVQVPKPQGLASDHRVDRSGQFQFVPPGGGVTTVAVNAVVKRPAAVS